MDDFFFFLPLLVFIVFTVLIVRRVLLICFVLFIPLQFSDSRETTHFLPESHIPLKQITNVTWKLVTVQATINHLPIALYPFTVEGIDSLQSPRGLKLYAR